jgi:AraC-like DNA-binding protein
VEAAAWASVLAVEHGAAGVYNGMLLKPARPPRRVVTSDLREAIAAVASVYCPHEVAIVQSNRGIEAALESLAGLHWQSVSLRYSAPVHIDAGTFENLLLFMTCADGSARASQGRHAVAWSKGQTLPLSPNLPSRLELDRQFWQRSVRLDKAFVEDVCSRLIGRPLERSLRFELRPFAPELEQGWQQLAEAARWLESVDMPATSRSRQRFGEFLAALVLESHPHNYTDALLRECRPADPRIVRDAECVMKAAGADTTVSDIAHELRVSLRSLELGFRAARGVTPSQAHREIRLQAARRALLAPVPGTTVTSVALEQGFVHLSRFSGYYQARYGERPNTTLRRSRRAAPREVVSKTG